MEVYKNKVMTKTQKQAVVQALHDKAFLLVSNELNSKKKMRMLSATMSINPRRQIDVDLNS